MDGLNCRVSIQGFFCIICSSTNFHMAPQWYFTMPELEEYMKVVVHHRWDTAEVGTKIEAFAITGCDVVSESCHFWSTTFLKRPQTCYQHQRRRLTT
jgi:hypothetical protein